jgi:heavy metal sensor kinase
MTLRPVDKMVRKIRNIRSDNLSVRMPVVDTNDEIRMLGRTFNDMLDRLEKSFEAQRQIVQDLSHELKTPITILRGQLEVALKRPRTPEEYENVLKAGLGEIETIRRIIDDLLMLARLDSRAMTLEMKPVRLDVVIDYLLEDVRALADSKEIQVASDKSGAITIQANEIHLRRLFMNLLDNAVKYTDKGGRVEVRVFEESGNGVVVIQDNGTGIPAEHLPNIFDRFYRANKGGRADGYGLGLGIVKSIVDAHKGRIEVQSAPGQGTTFRVILPKEFPMELFAGQEAQETKEALA